MTKKRSVVVTGVSSGIGEACVEALIAAGFFVFGSVRAEADASRLQAAHGKNLAPLILDVTDAAQIEAARKEVEARLAGDNLAGLVNNAGVALPGPLLLQPIEEVRRQFEVNLFGQLIVIQSFAPLLGARANARGAPGRIVNMSSVSGKFAPPFLGAYAGSKHALEAFSDALRRELTIFGVDVIVIEPGAIATPIWDKAEAAPLDRYDSSLFAGAIRGLQKEAAERGRRGAPAADVAAAVLRALTDRRPPTRLRVIPREFFEWTLPRLLPERFLDRQIAKRLGLVPRKG